jgi:hypothetical protein
MSILRVAAVGILAGGFVVVSQFPGSPMRMQIPALAGILPVSAAAPAATAPVRPIDQAFQVRRVHLDDVVATVEIVTVPQAGPVRVQVNGKPDYLKEVRVHAVGDEVMIRQEVKEDEAWFPWNMFNKWSDDRRTDDLRIRVTMPIATPLEVEDMVGKLVAGNIDGPVQLGGHALDARLGNLQSAKIDIEGAGEIQIASVREIFGVQIAGAGEIRVGQVTGPVAIDIAGAGEVTVDGGRATSFDVDISGSGDVTFNGEVVNPNIEINGAGNVTVASYTGNLRQDINGAGDFVVKNRGGSQPQTSSMGPPAPPPPPPPQ